MISPPENLIGRMRELLAYDISTGVFTWRRHHNSRARAGARAGTVYRNGYRVIGIDGRYFGEHRLAWLWVHGRIPEGQIDHINGDRADNRIANLRDVNASVNAQNQRRAHSDKRSCRLIGATWDKWSGRWKAQIITNGKTVFARYFKSAEEAHAAYVEAKRKLHPGCTL